jgi:DNA-binding transcriptional MocR family regulator
MNAMTQAIVNAGIARAPTGIQRVWQCIKDNPGGITAARVADKTGISQANVSSHCSDLTARGMLHVEKRPMKVRAGSGWCARGVLFYSAVGDTYALKPRKHANKLKAKKAMEQAAPPPAPAAPPAPAPAPATPDIDHLTLAQARALYNVLHKLFGGR